MAAAESLGGGHGHRWVRSTSAALIVQALGAILAVLLQVLLVRLLGPGEFGIYAYVLNWTMLLAAVANFGMDGAALRFVAAYGEAGEAAAMRGFLRCAVWVVLAGTAAAGFLAVLADVLVEAGPLGGSAARLPALALIAFLALVLLHQSNLLGRGHPVAALMPDKVLRPLVTAVLAAAVPFALGRPLSAGDALAATALAAALALGALWLAERRVGAPAAPPPVFRTREWISTGASLLAVSLAQLVLVRGGVILAGLLLGATAAGQFAVIALLAGLVFFISSAASGVIAPKISGLSAAGETAALQRMVDVSTAAFSALALVLAVGLMVFAHPILALFGPSFVAAAPVLRILVLGQLVVVVGGPVGGLLTMTGHQKTAARLIAVLAAAYLALNLVLVPAWGLTGAALALTVVQVVRTFWLSWAAWRAVGIVPPALAPFRRLAR